MEDNLCDIGDRCDAGPDPTSCTENCIYCGKELQYYNGEWWTWDAKFFNNPKPQLGGVPRELLR